MININNKLLTYIAIGDAYCLAIEYINHRKHKSLIKKALSFKEYLAHPSHNVLPGMYSDDTAMSLANAEVLLNCYDIKHISNIHFASKWVEIYHRDRRDSYARGFQSFLDNTFSGAQFLNNIISSSNKNGAAMRSVPFGVLPTPRETLEIAELQAKITHDSPGGIFSSKAVALMSHFALHESLSLNYHNLKDYLVSHLQDDIKELLDKKLVNEVFEEGWSARIAGDEIGIVTALAVFELLISSNSLLEILSKTIQWGGDTDSVAAIALGIASCRCQQEFKDDLPGFMMNDLEPNQKYGTKFLNKISEELMDKFS